MNSYLSAKFGVNQVDVSEKLVARTKTDDRPQAMTLIKHELKTKQQQQKQNKIHQQHQNEVWNGSTIGINFSENDFYGRTDVVRRQQLYCAYM